MDILLIDDNPDYLTLLRDALHANGYTVHTAKDGIEGCEILESAQIDLIISDIRMPRFDGLKVHAFAREMESHKDTKFIFISAFKDAYRGMMNLDGKRDFFLEKTTPLNDILKMVDSLIFSVFEGAWI